MNFSAVSISSDSRALPIAIQPSQERDRCKFLVVSRDDGKVCHHEFRGVTGYLNSGDCLVVNASRVFPARLPFWIGEKKGDLLLGAFPVTGIEVPAKIERRFARLLNKVNGQVTWRDGSPGKINIRRFDETLGAFILNVEFTGSIEDFGEIPLPPYILKARKAAGFPEIIDQDQERYQCVYAQETGSVACPTAGLHWTRELLEKVKSRGISIVPIVMHVGFASIVHGQGRDSVPSEFCSIGESEAEIIRRAKVQGRRLVACGTSVVRALEGSLDESGQLRPNHGPVSLFIRPGYPFKMVDAMITNFHLPDSTNFFMTQAFLGGDRNLREIYAEAMGRGYQFYSFGDAMMIL